ncbi:MAG: ethanolamine ammonia lyase large subunit [Ignavibacteriales bacterium UTCHB2]|jgi:ethanolamine ammonia-lyase large subunit|nr:MAG: ethanolamine ammonia lyase large subunit [Ignavibacteriales bacterium UTCHB2]HQJ45466.1 ethanolamine ammonia-lyase subunit EutB [Ignavibacteriaceae bacterium]
MRLSTQLFGKTYTFKDVKDVLAKANEQRSGDVLAGVAAETSQERVAAKYVLSNLTLADLRNNPVVPYEKDEVTRVIQDSVNETFYSQIKNWSVGELREYILADSTTHEDIEKLRRGLTSEMVAGVAKLMSNMDLIYAGKKIRVVAKANSTVGLPGRFGQRLQPNDPRDDVKSIRAEIFEGLAYGSGDVVIGINPVIDTPENIKKLLIATDEIIQKYQIPTQNCILAHVSNQMKAIKDGAPAGLIFQSIAGSEKGNNEFGISVAMLDEAYEIGKHYCKIAGSNMMYFETGQGAELSADAHFGADQVTLEARCYGLAKRYKPFMVNTVVGFIGPEYLYDGRQITRAGLEDHFMGKLTGIPMGADACYTNHANADQNTIENLTVLLVAAGCNFVMGVPMGDDIMLNYQTTSYHDAATVRQLLNLRPCPEFEKWMEKMGLMADGKLTALAGDPSIFS